MTIVSIETTLVISKERMRLMTVLARAYAHALQIECLGRRAGDFLVRNFRLLSSRESSPLSSQRSHDNTAGWRRVQRLGHLH